MHRIGFLLILFGLYAQINAQNLEPKVKYPDTLFSKNDTVYIKSPQWSKVMSLNFYQTDTIDWGTYGYKGVHFDIWTDSDTIKIPHVNHPYEQHVSIPLASNRDTTEMVLRFQATYSSDFSDDHIKASRNQTSVKNTKVYELANVILFLSSCSYYTGNKPETEYTKRISEYFEPFKNHTLIKILNKKCANDQWSTYYGFRENSICYKFVEHYLEYDTPYKHVYHDNSRKMGGNFRNLLYLVQDFADVSNFESFYESNSLYYEQLESRLTKLLPLQKMWDWLEEHFPQKLDSYKVIFSPLIGGSHSTQKFIRGYFKTPEYTECLMFINSSEYLDQRSEYSQNLKEGLMSGIVFTEIDHNYVNPSSSEYIDEIKDLISNKDLWATKEAQQNYQSEYAIFNEYMTHSLFCLYALDVYDAGVSSQIIKQRIKLMERRGYPRFQQFNDRLIEIMKVKENSVYKLYPKLLEDMKKIK